MAAVAELLTAVKNGDIRKVRELIEKGENVNVFTTGRTPLGTAAHQGNVQMLELLLNCGKLQSGPSSAIADKPRRKASKKCDGREVGGKLKKRKASVEGNNGYFEVVHDDRSDDSESDINKNVSIDETAETPEGMDNMEWDTELALGDEAVGEDIWSDQYKWYAKILANSCPTTSDLPIHCDVNLQDAIGRTAIHYAAETGHINAVKLLLNAGCRGYVADRDGLTPLHFAAYSGHPAIVELLISSGCDVNAKSTDKLSPLHYAATKGHVEVVQVLLAAGAKVDPLDNNERTPLMCAVGRGHLEVVQALIEKKAKINIADVKGYTALSEAVYRKSVPMVEMLLEAGARILPTDFLLHFTILHRHFEMAEILAQAGALVNVRDNNGDTPLLLAAKSSQPNMVKLLLDHGAIPDMHGYLDTTPLVLAVKARVESPEILTTLVERGADMEKPVYGQTILAHALMDQRVLSAVVLVSLGAKLHPNHLPFLLKNDSVLVYKSLLYAGEDIFSLFPLLLGRPTKLPEEETITSGYDWVVYAKYNPLSLSNLCRRVVRSQGTRPLSIWLSSLQVPPLITRYLMLDDVVKQALSEVPSVAETPYYNPLILPHIHPIFRHGIFGGPIYT